YVICREWLGVCSCFFFFLDVYKRQVLYSLSQYIKLKKHPVAKTL
ncbi:hypothetical protein MU476_15250, partial [Staphylococcus aureus]